MGTISHTEPPLRDDGMRPGGLVAIWTPLTSANPNGDAFEWIHGRDRSVQLTGTFGNATVLIQGSNDGTNYVTLTDPQGNALSFTTAGLEQIEEATRYIKPTSSGGDGTQSVTVTIFAGGH